MRGPEGEKGSGLFEWVFRLALITLPKDFRIAYGGEIYSFHLARMEATGGSRLRASACWISDLLDLLAGGILERGRLAKAAWGRGRKEEMEWGGAGRPGGGPGREKPGVGVRIETWIRDLQFALRSLTRSPGFTGVSVFSLAVGIGLLTGFSAFFRSTWLEPVPGVENASTMVELTAVTPGREMESFSYPDFRDLRRAETPFRALAGWMPRDGTLLVGAGGEHVRTMSVSANYFQLLGVVPEKGRGFLPEEDQGPGQHPVAVVSHQMWRERLGGSSSIIGQTIVLNQVPYTVVGVTPRGFTGHRILVPETEIWTPLMQDPALTVDQGVMEDRQASWLRVLGLRKGGVSLEECNAALGTLFARFQEDHPETNEQRRARAYAFGPVPAVGRNDSLLATLLLGGVLGLVLMIISGNVAGMVLARSVTREQEIAVRLALGSGRDRLARLLFLEALLLSLMGGIAGGLLGVWGLDIAYALLPGAPRFDFNLDWYLLFPAGALVLGTTLLVGALPAIRFSRPELISALKEGAGGGKRRAGRIHRLAATAQTGLALTLLVTSGLFVRAVGLLNRMDLGFEPTGLVTSRLDLQGVGIDDPEQAAIFLERIKRAVETVPGVDRVTLADGHPVDLVGNFTSVARLDRADESDARIPVEFTRVDEGYFETVDTPVLQGRGILSSDGPTSEPVMVVTESLAKRLWPGEEALGQQVSSRFGRSGPTEFTVVGVAKDVASSRPTENWDNVFVSLRQNYYSRVMVLARATSDPAEIYRPVREALLSVDPDLPYPAVVHAQSLVDRAGNQQRISARVAAGLGALAILLAAIGIYGVVAFAVSSRVREIGLRMAMGASRPAVLLGVLKDALVLAAPGLVAGFILTGVAATGFRAQLYNLSPVDPVSFLGAGGFLLLVILLASYFPARRASGIDPMEALRRE